MVCSRALPGCAPFWHPPGTSSASGRRINLGDHLGPRTFRSRVAASCAGRAGAFNGSFQWVIGDDIAEWCVEPLVALSSIPANDFGGLWFAGTADQGWGMSIENFIDGDGSTNLFIVLYVYDANGDPVWFFMIDCLENAFATVHFLPSLP